MNTTELLQRLQRHYLKPGPMPGGIFVSEVGTNNWNAGGRRCDALYVGFTSTSGRKLIGHELKVSRANWRHELDQPGKADYWADQCHAWYVVAPSTDIVPVEEVPPGWGLMVVNPRARTRLDIKVKATVHEDRQPSWDVTRSIMARLDTLQAAELRRLRTELESEYYAKLAAEVERLRAEGPPAPELDPAAQRAMQVVQAVLSRARTAQRETLGYITGIDQADVVSVLTDIAAAKRAARDLSMNVQNRLWGIQQLLREVDPELIARIEALASEEKPDAVVA